MFSCGLQKHAWGCGAIIPDRVRVPQQVTWVLAVGDFAYVLNIRVSFCGCLPSEPSSKLFKETHAHPDPPLLPDRSAMQRLFAGAGTSGYTGHHCRQRTKCSCSGAKTLCCTGFA